MAVSVTYKDSNRALQDWSARGKRMVLGTLTLSTYSTSGMTCSIGGFSNLDAIFFQPTGDGLYVSYVHSTSVLRVFNYLATTTAGATFEVPSDTEAALFGAVTFLAIGRD
jgi:hypothetical protein